MLTDAMFAVIKEVPGVARLASLASDGLVAIVVLVAAATWLAVSFRERRFNWVVAIEVGLGLFLAISIAGWLKVTYPELRPISYYTSEAGQHFDSFPSRHTLIATTLGFTLLPAYPEVGAGTLVVALAIGILRWIALEHWPIDIFVSWLLGMLLAIFINELTRFIMRTRTRR